MEWYLIPWKKYVDFNGRARRKEFWTFMLINTVIGAIIGAIFPPTVTSSGMAQRSAMTWIFGLITFIPSSLSLVSI